MYVDDTHNMIHIGGDACTIIYDLNVGFVHPSILLKSNGTLAFGDILFDPKLGSSVLQNQIPAGKLF